MDSFSTFCPFTGALLKSFKYRTLAEVEQDLASAENEFQRWRKVPLDERAKYLRHLGVSIKLNKDKLAHHMHREMGKSFTEAYAEVEKSALTCEYYAEKGPDFLANEIISDSPYSRSEVSFQPLGVIFSIMPWNFPLWQLIRFAAPAVMAGNVVLLKHSDLVPETAECITDIWQQTFSGFKLLHNVPMTHSVAAQVIAHPLIKAVTFTGSTQGGRAVAVEAAKNLKKVVLELGGNDAYLVCEDADLEYAARASAKSRLINVGQSCVAGKRFFVHKKIYAKFLSLFIEELTSTQIAPLAHKKFQSLLHSQVKKMKDWGGKILVGGVVPEGPGAFYPATVVECPTSVPGFHQEEIFGPVALVFQVESVEEGVLLANSSPYGLGGGIFTKDQRMGKSIVELDLQAGFVVVNAFVKSDPRTPFGGIKESGFGRELSRYGIMEFVNIKTIGVSEVNNEPS